MKQQNYRVAIDVGNSKVSVLVVVPNSESANKYEVVGFASVPYHADEDGSGLEQFHALRDAVAEAESKANVKIKRAYASLPDKKLNAFRKKDVVFKESNMITITDDEIAQAVEVASRVNTEQGEQVLHIIPHTYYLDEDHAVKNPLGMHSSELRIESQIITGSSESVTRLKELLRKCDIALDKVIVSQLAVAESTLTLDEMEEGVAVIDIGHTGTGMAMFEEGKLLHVASLPVGGRNATRDLVVSLAISFNDAEQIKREHGSCNVGTQKLGDDIDVQPKGLDESVQISKKDIAEIIKARYQELCQLLLHKLNEDEVKNAQISRLVFSGGGAQIMEFGTLARYVSQHQVKLSNPVSTLKNADAILTPGNAVIIGMILWSNHHLADGAEHVSVGVEADAATVEQSGFLKKMVGKLLRR